MPVITESTEPSVKLSVKVTRESLLPRADILLISTERNIIEKIGSLDLTLIESGINHSCVCDRRNESIIDLKVIIDEINIRLTASVYPVFQL